MEPVQGMLNDRPLYRAGQVVRPEVRVDDQFVIIIPHFRQSCNRTSHNPISELF